MCRFICEVRRQDGSPYLPCHFRNLCLGILRYLKEEYKRFDLKFMDTDNAQFAGLRATLDGQMKKLNSEGVGNVVKQAEPISPLEEEKLWETSTFGIDNSESLFNTVYFYNCKIFGLRAADEHSSLRLDQFVFGKDDEGEFVDFLGGTCKNNQGGLKQGGKVPFSCLNNAYYVFSDVFANTSKSQTQDAIVKVLREYMESIPLGGPFYRRPLSARDGENVRYSHQKVGVHTFEKLFKKICDKAGKNSNSPVPQQSGRTAGSRKDGPQKSSCESVQAHERNTAEKISDLLQPPNKESKIEPNASPPKSPVATCTLPDKSDAKPVTIKFVAILCELDTIDVAADEEPGPTK
ncbi:uncharacterized protein LOC124143075 [Haliotis rufescens]|uniref:uncharacterized protein LOC124143075 n=1 Tax=Haliotis rufescens TaxID=6454 RepID=UPI001EB0A0AC|nr:uncharacterized protein LOC124143075 [Haliotis rufescens]